MLFLTHITSGTCAGACACNHAHQMEKTAVFLENIECKVMLTEAYLEPSPTSKIELFC